MVPEYLGDNPVQGIDTVARSSDKTMETETKRKTTATPLRLSVDFSDFLGIYTGSLCQMDLVVGR